MEGQHPVRVPEQTEETASEEIQEPRAARLSQLNAFKLALTSVMLLWIFYASTAQLIWMLPPHLPLPTSPVAALDPFRIANRYGLFAVMTRGRYEIEFQGSNDGQNWIAYPFRYKPQDLTEKPRIYAPYQPRFDWNLWFASFRELAREHHRPEHRRAAACRIARGAHAFRWEPIPQRAAEASAGGAVAVLVYNAGGKACDRILVAPRIHRALRAAVGDRTRRQGFCG